ncbi:hypothetical protein HNQ35_001569 [Cerasibacillus quisquiliarum]|uniref:Uncharacterized protein n=1 Tax=Cerasibacillus quisquiliarum TaxID=227865 RepID=A0A511UVU2_9BACI|nr:hypothetical protein [Cerasibacillus quisquiliarum]MBB5146367.1 hypothetical protein [Cerasibacillus quisquiliarum]GEN30694.1 hypothetical protein CQU01_09320 [Cerasibacillus quisquiliarum]
METKQKQTHFHRSTTKDQNKRAHHAAFTDKKRKQKETSKHTVGGF